MWGVDTSHFCVWALLQPLLYSFIMLFIFQIERDWSDWCHNTNMQMLQLHDKYEVAVTKNQTKCSKHDVIIVMKSHRHHHRVGWGARGIIRLGACDWKPVKLWGFVKVRPASLMPETGGRRSLLPVRILVSIQVIGKVSYVLAIWDLETILYLTTRWKLIRCLCDCFYHYCLSEAIISEPETGLREYSINVLQSGENATGCPKRKRSGFLENP